MNTDIEETIKLGTMGSRVLPDDRAHCANRPQHPPFLWQRFEIKDPHLWTIFNVAVGNRSLFKQNPDGGAGIPSHRLNEEGLLHKDVCQSAQDFSIEAAYIGPNPEGEPFDCDVIGRVPR